MGNAGVSRPAIGFRDSSGGAIGVDEGVQAGGGEVRNERQPHPARPIIVHLDGAGDEHLALAAAARTAFRRIFAPLRISVSSISTKPFSGERSGAPMARRSWAPSSHAVLYEPSPSCFCSCRAEMPLVGGHQQNQTVSASFEPCIAVPAVTDVCLPQPAHSPG